MLLLRVTRKAQAVSGQDFRITPPRRNCANLTSKLRPVRMPKRAHRTTTGASAKIPSLKKSLQNPAQNQKKVEKFLLWIQHPYFFSDRGVSKFLA